MERNEILIVIAAVLAVCVLIAGIRMVRGDNGEDAESSTIVTQSPPIQITAATTNYWDYLHAQTETTTTTELTGEGTDTQSSDAAGGEPAQTDSTGEGTQTDTTGTGAVVTEQGSDDFVISQGSESAAPVSPNEPYFIPMQ